jgi:hypothetical protein
MRLFYAEQTNWRLSEMRKVCFFPAAESKRVKAQRKQSSEKRLKNAA